jgi:hypothetical protein
MAGTAAVGIEARTETVVGASRNGFDDLEAHLSILEEAENSGIVVG